jgi:hypothetical protein
MGDRAHKGASTGLANSLGGEHWYPRFMILASQAQDHAHAVRGNPDQVRHLDQEGRQLENWVTEKKHRGQAPLFRP